MHSNPSKLATVALVIAVVGCAAPHARPVSGAPAVTARRVENLRVVASRLMACPVDAITTEPLTDQVWQARGCGDTRELAIVDRGSMARWEPVTPPNVRASNELACPLDRLVISAPTGAERDVSGCGRAASYQLACSAVQCEWVMTGHSGDWARRGGVTVTPPGQQPPPTPPVASSPAPRSPVVVVPDHGGGGSYSDADPAVDQAVRQALDAQRASILSCARDAAGVSVRAQWGPDGLVMLSLTGPWAGTPSEQCVRQTVGAFQVTTGRPGSLVHVIR